MAYTQDAADQVVKLAIRSMGTIAEVAGRSAVRAAKLIYDVLRDERNSAGKTRLSRLVKSGKQLKVFAVLDEDLEMFCREARKYAVQYCVLKDRTVGDGTTDILVKAEDAGKINRIYERFSLAVVDTEAVLQNINRAREKESFLYRLTEEDPGSRGGREQNPAEAETAAARRSEPALRNGEVPETGVPPEVTRPSVRKALEDIRNERKNKAGRSPEAPQKSELARRVSERGHEK